MAQQAIDLSEFRGRFYFDSLSKSTLNVPSAYCTDLKGCGTDTHVAGGDAYTLNYLDDCIPARGLQMSYSGYTSLDNADVRLGNFNATVSGQAFAATLTTLTASLIDAVVAPGVAVPVASIEAAMGPTGWVQRGGDYVLLSTGLRKRIIAQVSIPVGVIVADQCGEPEGVSADISASIFGFDPLTCQSGLLWQASLSLFAGYNLYGDPINGLAVQTDTGLILQPIFGSQVNCASAQTTVAANAAALDKTFTIGAA